jgi:hypothetical protein
MPGRGPFSTPIRGPDCLPFDSDVSIDGVSMALTQRSEFAVIVHAMADNWRVSSRQCARRFKAATASFRSHCDRQQAPESRA